MAILTYGKVSWSFEEDFNPSTPCCPFPVIKINKYFKGFHRTALNLFKLKCSEKILLDEAYLAWSSSFLSVQAGQDDAINFLHWLKKRNLSIQWRSKDFTIHPYFYYSKCPSYEKGNNFEQDSSFSIKPVQVDGRNIKLCLEDDSIMSLLNISYGDEIDFLELVKDYIQMRFHREKWGTPSPTFLDWVKILGKKPLFKVGQLSFYHNI